MTSSHTILFGHLGRFAGSGIAVALGNRETMTIAGVTRRFEPTPDFDPPLQRVADLPLMLPKAAQPWSLGIASTTLITGGLLCALQRDQALNIDVCPPQKRPVDVGLEPELQPMKRPSQDLQWMLAT